MKIIGLGAGGHARVMLEVFSAVGGYEVVELLDPDPSLWGKEVTGVPVYGGDERLDACWRAGIRHAFVGIGSSAETRQRSRVFDLFRRGGFTFADAVHPTAVVSPSARMGLGVSVMANAVVGTGATLADNVLVNTGAVVEHDCVIGSHVHIGTGAHLAGAVRIGARSHIGVGSSFRQGVTVGASVVVGAGAVVVDEIRDGVTVVGVPAREIRRP